MTFRGIDSPVRLIKDYGTPAIVSTFLCKTCRGHPMLMQMLSNFRSQTYIHLRDVRASLAIGLLLLLSWPSLSPAQGLSGISGTVIDQSGGVVADATVT